MGEETGERDAACSYRNILLKKTLFSALFFLKKNIFFTWLSYPPAPLAATPPPAAAAAAAVGALSSEATLALASEDGTEGIGLRWEGGGELQLYV